LSCPHGFDKPIRFCKLVKFGIVILKKMECDFHEFMKINIKELTTTGFVWVKRFNQFEFPYLDDIIYLAFSDPSKL